MRLLIVLLLFISNVSASDYAREKRWADQTVDAIMDGDALWLEANEHEFLSIYTEAEEESDKALIVIHGSGIHPNWDQIVKPIRVKMTSRGWNTLSIQMPILANDASYQAYAETYPQVPGRLLAAQEYLIEQGNKTIVIVAHSQGATMSSYSLSRDQQHVKGYVAIGQSSNQQNPAVNSALALKSITVPVLDIYGSEDLPSVLTTSEKRKLNGRINKDYSQIMIHGANHFFDDMNDDLINAIDEWLKRYF